MGSRKSLRRRIGCLRQVIHPQAFGVGVSVLRRLARRAHGAKREHDPVVGRFHMDVARRHGAGEIRSGEQDLAALAAVHARRPNIGDGHLPGIDDLPVQAAIRTRRGNFQHGRLLLQVGIGDDVVRRAVRRNGLHFRRRRAGHRNDVIVRHTERKCLDAAVLNPDARQRPQHGLERALVFDLVVEIDVRTQAAGRGLPAERLLRHLGCCMAGEQNRQCKTAERRDELHTSHRHGFPPALIRLISMHR